MNNKLNGNLIKKPKQFQYLCGLSIDQFNIILNCVTPYIHLIPYPDCAGVHDRRSTDVATELLISVLMICRHGLHQGRIGVYFRKVNNNYAKNIYWMGNISRNHF